METEQSHAESLGLEVIDWVEVCNFFDQGEYSEVEFNRYRKLSLNWNTCAVGQTSSKIPRKRDENYDGGDYPVDFELQHYGTNFAAYFAARSFHNALDLIHSIDNKVNQLLSEQ